MNHRIAKQKFGILLLTVILLVMAIVPVYAVQQIDLEGTDGSITFTMSYSVQGGKNVKMNGGELQLYTVAYADSGNTGYFFNTKDGHFAGSAEAKSIEKMDTKQLAEKNAELARKLAEKAKKVNADQTAAIQDGKAEFSGLRSGLYLIVMPKADKTGASITPFLISVPDKDGNYAITAKPKPEIKAPTQTVTPTPTPKVPGKPKLPQTGQLWWPVLLMAGAGIILVCGGMWLRRRPENKK